MQRSEASSEMNELPDHISLASVGRPPSSTPPPTPPSFSSSRPPNRPHSNSTNDTRRGGTPSAHQPQPQTQTRQPELKHSLDLGSIMASPLPLPDIFSGTPGTAGGHMQQYPTNLPLTHTDVHPQQNQPTHLPHVEPNKKDGVAPQPQQANPQQQLQGSTREREVQAGGMRMYAPPTYPPGMVTANVLAVPSCTIVVTVERAVRMAMVTSGNDYTQAHPPSCFASWEILAREPRSDPEGRAIGETVSLNDPITSSTHVVSHTAEPAWSSRNTFCARSDAHLLCAVFYVWHVPPPVRGNGNQGGGAGEVGQMHPPTNPPEGGGGETGEAEPMLLGSVRVDLTGLRKGVPSVEGWYHIQKATGREPILNRVRERGNASYFGGDQEGGRPAALTAPQTINLFGEDVPIVPPAPVLPTKTHSELTAHNGWGQGQGDPGLMFWEEPEQDKPWLTSVGQIFLRLAVEGPLGERRVSPNKRRMAEAADGFGPESDFMTNVMHPDPSISKGMAYHRYVSPFRADQRAEPEDPHVRRTNEWPLKGLGPDRVKGETTGEDLMHPKVTMQELVSYEDAVASLPDLPLPPTLNVPPHTAPSQTQPQPSEGQQPDWHRPSPPPLAPPAPSPDHSPPTFTRHSPPPRTSLVGRSHGAFGGDRDWGAGGWGGGGNNNNNRGSWGGQNGTHHTPASAGGTWSSGKGGGASPGVEVAIPPSQHSHKVGVHFHP